MWFVRHYGVLLPWMRRCWVPLVWFPPSPILLRYRSIN